MSRKTRTIDGARVTCDIIDLLQERGTAGITEIADELDRSKSSVHAYLSTLVEKKYVVKSDHQYSLSLRYVELGEYMKSPLRRNDIILTEIDGLADITNEGAQFATIEQGDLIYLYKTRGKSDMETIPSIGSREQLHSTSLGKAILSCLKRERVLDLVGTTPLPRKTEHTVVDIDTLVDELRKTRERGYAIDDEENKPGLRSIAAPIVLNEEDIIGAISITGPTKRMSFNRIENELEDRIKRSANIIQMNTTFEDSEFPTLGISREAVSDLQQESSTGENRNEDILEPNEPLHETEFADVVEAEWCKICPVHSGKPLSVHTGSTRDGAQVQQHSWHNGDMQKFQLTQLPDDTYRIDAVHSGKPIEIRNASTSGGASIQQNTWTGNDHQRWRIERLGESDTFRLINVNSHKVIDVVGESKDDGTSAIQWNWIGRENQRFRFYPPDRS